MIILQIVCQGKFELLNYDVFSAELMKISR